MNRHHYKKIVVIGLGIVISVLASLLVSAWDRKEISDPFVQEVTTTKDTPIEVIPCGEPVGIKIQSDGVYVVGSSEIETDLGRVNLCADKILKGDRIYSINNQALNSKDELKTIIEQSGNKPLDILLKRGNMKEEIIITPVYSIDEATYKLGLWVKDGTQGIGTITYINPKNGMFGALGHGIMDAELKTLIALKNGEITKAQITSITKGKKGVPGQLGGAIEDTKAGKLGVITLNTSIGIYGKLDGRDFTSRYGQALPIAYQDEINQGPAQVLINLDGNAVKSYNAVIQKVARYSTEPSKGLVIKIIDPELLEQTNGIIQGMSGSPIVQKGKLVGAITHVFVNDPSRGYGIFIENMLAVE